MTDFKLLYSMLTKNQKRELVWVVLCACLIAILEALSILAIFFLFSLLTEAPSENSLDKIILFFNLEEWSKNILTVGFVVLALIVIKNTFALWNSWYQNHFMSFVRHSLSTRLFSSILDEPYSYFLGKNSEILKARVLSDVDRITDGYLRGLVSLVSEALVAVAIMIVLFSRDFIGTFILLSGLSLVGVCLHFSLKKIAGNSSHDLTAAHHRRYFIGGAVLSGIKAGSTESFFYKLFLKLLWTFHGFKFYKAWSFILRG